MSNGCTIWIGGEHVTVEFRFPFLARLRMAFGILLGNRIRVTGPMTFNEWGGK